MTDPSPRGSSSQQGGQDEVHPDAAARSASQPPHPPPSQSKAAMPSTDNTTGTSTGPLSMSRRTDLILGLAVVDFNHLQGPIVEWSHPKALQQDHPDLCAALPFCALPDGSHLSDEDFAHFHLYCPSISKNSTVFGISCNRQIAAEKLAVRAKDVTRSTVQKAVVVLARQPIFAPLREKLGIVTRAYFAQGDLADTQILVDFHDTLEAGLRAAGLRGEDVAEDDDFADDDQPTGSTGETGAETKQSTESSDLEKKATETHSQSQSEEANSAKSGPSSDSPAHAPATSADVLAQSSASYPPSVAKASQPSDLREGVMYMGTSLRELVYRFRFKTLVLVKLLLLQRRIMFFGYPVERLCVFEYTLVSLIPGLLLSLSDCSDPSLDYTRRHKPKIAEDVRTSDRRSLLRFCGCPLRLFGEDAFFQPYLPLQQIEMLKARSWLVGTTNLIFKQQKEFRPDVIVDLEQSSIEFVAPLHHPSQTMAGNFATPDPVSRPPRSSGDSAGPGSAGSAGAASNGPTLQQMVALTSADRKWMDELVTVVTESYNPSDPTRPTTMRYEGSEDWVRARFEDYICSMLACVKYSDFLQKSEPSAAGSTATASTKRPPMPFSAASSSSLHHTSASMSSPSTQQGTSSGFLTPSGGSGLTLAGANTNTAGIGAPDGQQAIEAFNALFLSGFKRTRAYDLWATSTSPLLFDLVPYCHPFSGKVSALEDVALRLKSAGLVSGGAGGVGGGAGGVAGAAQGVVGGVLSHQDWKAVEEQMRDTREYVGKAGRGLFNMAEKFGNEVARRRREWVQQQEAAAAAGDSAVSGEKGQTRTNGEVDVADVRPRNEDSTALDNVSAPGGPTAAPDTPVNNGGSGPNGSAASQPQPGAATLESLAPHAAAAQQAALQAGTEVRAAFGRFSSYLGSRGWGAAASPSAPGGSST